MTSAELISDLQRKLAEGLATIDPHHRLLGRPVSYRIIDGRTLEITFRDVAGIADDTLDPQHFSVGNARHVAKRDLERPSVDDPVADGTTQQAVMRIDHRQTLGEFSLQIRYELSRG